MKIWEFKLIFYLKGAAKISGRERARGRDRGGPRGAGGRGGLFYVLK